jgi:hypothetical protein
MHESLSFFIVLLAASVVGIHCLWNFAVRETPLRKLTAAATLYGAVAWGCLVIMLLVAVQTVRRAMTATLESREFVFSPITVDAASPWNDLLFGWMTFPLRTFPKIRFDSEVFLIGVGTAILALIVLELIGRISFHKHWKTRFSFSLFGGFVLLDLLTLAMIAVVRQSGCILISM